MKSKVMWAVGLVAVLGLSYFLYVESYGMPAFIRINRAEKAVATKLFDGDSAKFRNVKEHNIITVCGEVNAKNRFGAYIGFRGFSVTGNDHDPMVSFEENEKDASTIVYRIACDMPVH